MPGSQPMFRSYSPRCAAKSEEAQVERTLGASGAAVGQKAGQANLLQRQGTFDSITPIGLSQANRRSIEKVFRVDIMLT